MNDDWTKLVEKQDILEYMIFLYNFSPCLMLLFKFSINIYALNLNIAYFSS